MSVIGQLKKAVNYEGNVPTCKTCTEYSAATVYLTVNSIPHRSNHRCNKFEFTVAPGGCCDYFRGKDGSSLNVDLVNADKVIRLQQKMYR